MMSHTSNGAKCDPDNDDDDEVIQVTTMSTRPLEKLVTRSKGGVAREGRWSGLVPMSCLHCPSILMTLTLVCLFTHTALQY